MIRTLVASVACCCLAVGTASAGIVSSVNTIVHASPLADVDVDVHEDDINAQAFLESEGTLASTITLDITNDGGFGPNGSDTPIPGSLPAGSLYRSYYIFTDPVGNGPVDFTGSATFGTRILGLIVSGDTLDDTDSVIGAAGTDYPFNVNFRGLELGGGDTVFLSSDFRTVRWDVFRTVGVVDGFRVIAAVPEPSTIAMAGLGASALIGVGVLRRRNRHIAPA